MREVIVIAGPNGAGKSTFTRQVLGLRGFLFLNADEIALEQPEFAHPIAAGRELVRRMSRFEAERSSFVLETTLASGLHAPRFARWAELGYRTTLHFIELPTEEYAIERVARRVTAGGHAVPEDDIRRRFRRGVELFHGVYKPLPDRWFHWRSDERGIRLVDEGRNG